MQDGTRKARRHVPGQAPAGAREGKGCRRFFLPEVRTACPRTPLGIIAFDYKIISDTMVFDIYLIRLLADNLMNKLSFLDSMARIPVYQVSVPQYQVKKLNAGTATIEYAATPWFSFRIPKAYEDNKLISSLWILRSPRLELISSSSLNRSITGRWRTARNLSG